MARERLIRFLARPDLEGDRQLKSDRRSIGGGSSLQCCTDGCLSHLVLVNDGRSSHSKTTQASVPKRIDIRYQLSRLVVLHHDVGQTSPFQQATKLVGVGKSEHRI